MSKFLKVKGVQCDEKGNFLHPNPTTVNFFININLIKAVFIGGDICLENRILSCDSNKTYFCNIHLINPTDLDDFIINK